MFLIYHLWDESVYTQHFLPITAAASSPCLFLLQFIYRRIFIFCKSQVFIPFDYFGMVHFEDACFVLKQIFFSAFEKQSTSKNKGNGNIC